MTMKIKHNKAHVLYKALVYDHCAGITYVGKIYLFFRLGSVLLNKLSSTGLPYLVVRPLLDLGNMNFLSDL